MAISFYNRKDHGWRDAYNPLRGLSLPKLISLLEAGERGDYSDLQWLYFYMERSDAVIYSVLQRRRASLLAVDWDIRLIDDGDKTLAREQAAFLAEVYDRIDNFRAAVPFNIFNMRQKNSNVRFFYVSGIFVGFNGLRCFCGGYQGFWAP